MSTLRDKLSFDRRLPPLSGNLATTRSKHTMKRTRSLLVLFVAGVVFLFAGHSNAETICYDARPVTIRCLHGRIVDQIGGPVSHATVAILRDGVVVTNVQTNEDGRFEFQGVKDGNYDLRAEHPSFKADQYPIVVKSKGNCKNSIEMILGTGFEGECPNARLIKHLLSRL